jgi:hypothetical protein
VNTPSVLQHYGLGIVGVDLNLANIRIDVFLTSELWIKYKYDLDPLVVWVIHVFHKSGM